MKNTRPKIKSPSKPGRLDLIDQAVDACRTAATIGHLLEFCGADKSCATLPATLASDAGGIIRHESMRARDLLNLIHKQG